MTRFDSNYTELLESFGGPLTKRVYAPRIKLSEQFIRAFREEYRRQCKPVQILDENDEVMEEKPRNPKKVLEQMQKALAFISR
jgi:uncharacterized protein YnzC (UPF0291/DUF896 family)